MHVYTLIIKLMDVLIIYLISRFIHGFVFKTYTLLQGFQSADSIHAHLVTSGLFTVNTMLTN